MLPFEDLSLQLNLLFFALGSVVIWVAGTRLSRYADALSDRTGIGKAFIGALLLGGITSLPEGATTVTASAIGNAPLAVNNILGGVAMQITLLAVADAVAPGCALSARVRSSAILLQAALLILVLTLAAAAIALGDMPILGLGAWTSLILGVSIAGFFLMHRHPAHPGWKRNDQAEKGDEEGGPDPEGTPHAAQKLSTPSLLALTSIAALAILLAGFVVARSADVISAETAIGSSFMGMLFVAVATSLPEASTTLSAVKIGQYQMAFSNILGANILDLAILFIADLTFTDGPVLNTVGRFSLVAALLGILLTAIYLVGLIERRKKVFLGAGLDSLLVLLLYLGGMLVLYPLR